MKQHSRPTTEKPIAAQLERIAFDPATTALVIIDMQRDFLDPGGFGAALGNEVSLLRACIAPCEMLLAAVRKAGMTVIHTREGHNPDLSDLPPEKLRRCPPGKAIGDPGPMGRILIRGEAGHDFIPELQPVAGEVVIENREKGRSTTPRLLRFCQYTTSALWSSVG